MATLIIEDVVTGEVTESRLHTAEEFLQFAKEIADSAKFQLSRKSCWNCRNCYENDSNEYVCNQLDSRIVSDNFGEGDSTPCALHELSEHEFISVSSGYDDDELF